VESLETELERARALSVEEIADRIETIGFECTHCGACCRSEENCGGEDDQTPHTATVFPDEIRQIQSREEYDWRDVARPMPYGIVDEAGETFEWALQTDSCGDCTFYEENGGEGGCSIHGDRPLICQTYPFSLDSVSPDTADGLGTTEPMGGVVEREGIVRAHECEGLGRDISRADAEALAKTLKKRAVRELTEAIDVRDNYEPADSDGVVVHDSEGTKRPDGTPL
jgi:Fe-S-cluster containining protein